MYDRQMFFFGISPLLSTPRVHTPKLAVSRTAHDMKDDAVKDGKTARCVGGEGET